MIALMPYLIGLALLATAGVLFVGLLSMMWGGNFSKRYSNRLTRMRVAFQAAVVFQRRFHGAAR
jgi:hypothetical protein